MHPFDRSEYLDRIERVKMRMREHGIDVLLASHPANMNYLTGYDGWSYYVHQLVALSLDAEEPVWIGREMDAAGARLTAFIRPTTSAPTPTSTSTRATSTACTTWQQCSRNAAGIVDR